MVLILALLPVLGLQSDEDGAKVRAKLDQINLQLMVLGRTFDPVELVPVLVRFTSVSKTNVTLMLNPRLPGRAILKLGHPDGAEIQVPDFGMKGSVAPLDVELAPGQFAQYFAVVSMKFLHGRDFSNPTHGRWTVTAEHGHGASRVRSVPVEFQVAVNPRLPAKARELLSRENWHRFAMGGELGDLDTADFRGFVLSHQPAAQKDLMALLIARRDFVHYRYEPGADALRAALKSGPRTLGRDTLSRLLVHCLWRLGQRDEALRVLTEVILDPLDVSCREFDPLRAATGKPAAR